MVHYTTNLEAALKENKADTVVSPSVDEATFVIKPTEQTIGEYPENWYQIAMELVGVITDKLTLETLFGSITEAKTPPAGYNYGFTFENLPYYFSIAFHDRNFVMGIVIKFSASALHHYINSYQEFYGQTIDIAKIAQKLNEPYWELRLSRIDLVVDYFNFDMTVNALYKSLMKKDILLLNHKKEKNTSKIQGLEIDGTVDTFYIGSRKKNSNAILRVYNKKKEQLETRGRLVHLTNFCNTWVRFEASYRGNYANQILKLLLEISTNNQLSELIFSKVTDKYRFYDTKTSTIIPFTDSILDKIGDYPNLTSTSSRNNDLIATMLYIMKGSGFYPLLKKVEEIWGVEARDEFVSILIDTYKAFYTPNQDVHIWLKKYSPELEVQSFHSYLKDATNIYIENNVPENRLETKEK